ncbi:MAG: hypothetical protein KF773_12255 [Deltaproteobacteria bacterium]|nr:hypothetical protein [Deltaproteobacteria bacterium]
MTEFQSDAFDARVFELYLSAYFSASGFAVDRTHARPDFVIERDGLRAAVEATTTNPSQGGVLGRTAARIEDLDTPSEITEYCDGELAVRLSNALHEKMRKQYWNLDHVRDAPFVIAIETFHDPHALQLSDTALTQYLYGLRAEAEMTDRGELLVGSSAIATHQKATKVVRSGFFDQPETERVSAVLFTNAGTVAKFSRMGYLAGVGGRDVHILRRGTAYDPDPDAMLPRFFQYDLDAAPHRETWGEGLVCVHNPNALHPLPDKYFPDAVDSRLEDRQVISNYQGWHPVASITNVVHDRWRQKPRPMTKAVEIRSIPKQMFHEFVAVVPGAGALFHEEVWLEEASGAFLGLIVRARQDGDYGFAVFAPDQDRIFHPIENRFNFPTRPQAAMGVWNHITRLLSGRQRVFRR